MADEGPEAGDQFGACGQVFFDVRPRLRPTVQIPAVSGYRVRRRFGAGVYSGGLPLEYASPTLAMCVVVLLTPLKERRPEASGLREVNELVDPI